MKIKVSQIHIVIVSNSDYYHIKIERNKLIPKYKLLLFVFFQQKTN